MINTPRFELVSKYNNKNLIPIRSTKNSAGYDFFVAKDTLIHNYRNLYQELISGADSMFSPLTLEEVSSITKATGAKPTLVPTGVKAYIPEGYYLQLQLRSSCPLKNWLILANGVGIIDSDYVDNPSNEGEIFFQIINLFPRDILLQEGEKIGQGIFLPYLTTYDDAACGERVGGFGSTGQ